MRYYCQKALKTDITQSNLKNLSPENRIFRKNYYWLEIHFWGWWSYIVLGNIGSNHCANHIWWYSCIHCAKGLETITFFMKTRPNIDGRRLLLRNTTGFAVNAPSRRGYLKAGRTDLISIVIVPFKQRTHRKIYHEFMLSY